MDLRDGTAGTGRFIKGTAYVVQPELTARGAKKTRSTEDILEEAIGLTESLRMKVVGHRVAKIGRISPGHFLGKGQREMIGAELIALRPEIVAFNHTLSPVQQRNLEKEWKVKVIDRTGVILEIFGARAQTREGQLQVDLAALEYQRSRLVRAWTHLERQRGGGGFLGGPGERQMELDRRRIDERIETIKRDLEKVRRTRELGRKSRARVPFPVIALVGYTNAGKSTLFNKITNAKVFAKDLLFATLDPTMRRTELPNGQQAILSDTVGFIADLPTNLVTAFRATLEQISFAHAIVHVIDIASHDYKAQKEDVIKILTELGIDYESDERVIEVYNKIDKVDGDTRAELEREVRFKPRAVLVSALSGQGVDDFLKLAEEVVSAGRVKAKLKIRASDGKALAWLHSHAEVIARKDSGENMTIDVMIEPSDLGRFTNQYGYSPQEGKKRRK